MDRRSLLKGIGASGLLLNAVRPAFAAQGRASSSRRVIVVGGGIIGAGIAYELAKRGAQVTVLERKAPASGTTGDSYAYLNASTKSNSRPYFELNRLGMAGWRVWQGEAGKPLPIRWDGAVYWRSETEPGAKLDQSFETVKRWGYAGQHIGPDDLRRLLPTIKGGPVTSGAFFPEEGSVDPAGAVSALLDRATRLGARVRYPVGVTELLIKNGIVRGVRTDRGEISADTVVLAAGLGSKALAEAQGIRLPLNASTGILLHTQPTAPIVGRLAFAPRASFRQMTDGRILASIGHEGASMTGDGATAQISRDILDAAEAYLPALRNIPIERIGIGQRVLPADTFPIVGYAPGAEGLYLTTTHSGVTLAPIFGRFAATEILDGVRIDLLDGFRPERFS